MILEESALITPASLPIAISQPDGERRPLRMAASGRSPTDGLSLEDNERSLLAQALEKTDGNQTQAARLLRITRDTLRYKMFARMYGRRHCIACSSGTAAVHIAVGALELSPGTRSSPPRSPIWAPSRACSTRD